MRLRTRLMPRDSALAGETSSSFGVLDKPAARADLAGEGNHSFEALTLKDAVNRCVVGTWDMPDFQRGFVWNPRQSAMLADSLWRNYPIGFVLLCIAEPNAATQKSSWWIADGQQRLTSLSLLFGKEPKWWTRRPGQEWNKVAERYDIRFDIQGEGLSRFVVEH